MRRAAASPRPLRRALPLLGLTLGAALAAGCFAPHAELSPRRVETCLLEGHQAEWIEPGLGAALADAAARSGVPVEATRPRVGIPLPDGAAPLPADGTLFVVRWHADPVRTHPSLSLMPIEPGIYQLRLSAAGSVERDRALVHAFLARLGLADHPDLPAWEAELFVHGDQPGSTDGPKGFREASLHAEPKVGPLVADLLAREDGRLVPLAMGEGRWEADRWSLHLLLPTWTVALGEGADAIRLQADTLDQVRAHVLVRDGAEAWPQLQARMDTTLRRLGLPPATFGDAHGGPASC